MNNLLTYTDNIIEAFIKQNKAYPNIILMNNDTNKKFMKQYKESLRLDILGCIIADKEDNYKGIKIEIKETEALISAK
jgi:hypothetical protein